MNKRRAIARGWLARCLMMAAALSAAGPTAVQAGEGAEISALVADAASLQRLIGAFRKKPVEQTPAAPAPTAAPLPYWNEIQRASRRFAVPTPLIAAVIHCESNWDARALSVAGARGLMQVMPRTARCTFGARPGILWNPDDNIELGTAYLRVLANRYQGHFRRVLAAYNAGPTRIDAGKPYPTETHRYVGCVGKNYLRYARHLQQWSAKNRQEKPRRSASFPEIIRFYSQGSLR